MSRFLAAGAAPTATVSGSNLTWVVIVAVIGLLALGVAYALVREVLAASQGTQRMQEIARAVQEGAAAYLRGLTSSNGKVGVIGYCSGGRQSVLAACSLPLEAAVDCYGAFVVGTPPEGMPLKVGPIKHLIKDLTCPLLGLFGADDQYPSPDQVAELEDELKAHGKTYEFHSYEGAGHAFFNVNRPAYRPEAAMDGWQRIWNWYGTYLS